jgi:D-xylose transport system substrate-binding protein
MAAALNTLKNNVQGVLSANDGLAGGIITALTAQHLNGKVVVTGQDATDAGLQQICLGNQSMTVYKPLAKLAQAAANITDKFLHGKKYKGNSKKTQTGAGGTPTFLAPVETVTKSNILSTVIKDHFTTKAHLAPQCHL